MPWLTRLATVARRTGYPVTEVPGWQTRGHGPQPAVKGIVCHHTAGRDDMRVVRDGRPGLDGPLSQFWLRHDGHIFVVAAGRCWHNAPSTSDLHTNSNSLGIEAENDGRQAWPAVQLDSYTRLCAEICREFRLSASRVKGHKEVNDQKPDPHHIDMNAFRDTVAGLIKGDDDMQLSDNVPVGKTYDADFAQEKYPLSFVLIGAMAEAKRAKAEAAAARKEVAAVRGDLAEIKALLTKGQ